MVKVRQYIYMIGEGSLDLFISIIISMLVARSQGDSALGIFSYFISFYVLTGFVSEFGITKYLEREVAFNSDTKQRNITYKNAFKAVLLFSVLCTIVIIVLASYNTSLTRLNETLAAYIIIVLTLPLQNINKLKLAFLNGSGQHEEAAKLVITKRIVLVGIIFSFILINVSPPFLFIGFLLSECFLFIKMLFDENSFFLKQ